MLSISKGELKAMEIFCSRNELHKIRVLEENSKGKSKAKGIFYSPKAN